jgi:membrane protease YdiL (CAAX protease family)
MIVPHVLSLPAAARRARLWPLLMPFVRLPLILFGLGVTYGVLGLAGHSSPWPAAVSMTNVIFPLTADLGSLLLLVHLTRQEGVPLRTLLGSARPNLWRDGLLGLGLFVVLVILFQLSSLVAALVVYGPGIFDSQHAAPGGTIFVQPPRWVFWWSLLVLPLTVAFVEQMTYQGYALPRLVTLFGGRTWAALLVVSLGFALQHTALPLVDVQTSLARLLGTFPIGLCFGLMYLRLRRLWPLIIAHWAIDFIGLGLLPLLAVLNPA